LQILPCDSPPGPTSNLNHDRADQTIAGLAVIEFDANGEACVYNQTATHLIVDLQAYLEPTAIDDFADQRLVDTRTGTKPGDDSMTRFSGAPNSSAIVSLVATQTAGPGWLQILPCDSPPGPTSNLNHDRADQTIAGLAVIEFDANGEACVYNQTATHLIVDLQAYLEATAIDDFADQRLVDTRSR
jgi:hypothetical protein